MAKHYSRRSNDYITDRINNIHGQTQQNVYEEIRDPFYQTRSKEFEGNSFQTNQGKIAPIPRVYIRKYGKVKIVAIVSITVVLALAVVGMVVGLYFSGVFSPSAQPDPTVTSSGTLTSSSIVKPTHPTGQQNITTLQTKSTSNKQASHPSSITDQQTSTSTGVPLEATQRKQTSHDMSTTSKHMSSSNSPTTSTHQTVTSEKTLVLTSSIQALHSSPTTDQQPDLTTAKQSSTESVSAETSVETTKTVTRKKAEQTSNPMSASTAKTPIKTTVDKTIFVGTSTELLTEETSNQMSTSTAIDLVETTMQQTSFAGTSTEPLAEGTSNQMSTSTAIDLVETTTREQTFYASTSTEPLAEKTSNPMSTSTVKSTVETTTREQTSYASTSTEPLAEKTDHQMSTSPTTPTQQTVTSEHMSATSTTAQQTLPSYLVVYGVWSSWNPWSPCSESCGRGMQYHSRSCMKTSPTDLDCSGPNNKTRLCDLGACPDCNRTCINSLINDDCTACFCPVIGVPVHVLNARNVPIAGATIARAEVSYDILDKTDNNGHFSFNNICNGEILLIKKKKVPTATLR